MRIIAAILLIFASSLGSNAQEMPSQGTSQIVFLRPRTGTVIVDSSRSVVLRVQEGAQDPQLVGIGGGGTKITYRANPGQHMFVVIGGNADFMVANLLPNTTHYVWVQYLPSGKTRSHYSFKPVERNSNEFKDSLAAARSVEIDPAAANWLATNMPSVKQRMQDNYGPWLQKSASEKVVLGAPLSDAAQKALLEGSSPRGTRLESSPARNEPASISREGSSSPARSTLTAVPSASQVASAESFVVANPRDARAWRNLGDAHASNGDWPRAAKAFEESLALVPNDPQSLAGLASTYCKRYERNRLESVIEETRKTNPVLAEQIVRRCILP